MGSIYVFDDEKSLIPVDEEVVADMERRGVLEEMSDVEKCDSEAEKVESDMEKGDDEDSDNWDDEDGSDDSNAEDLLDYLESKFLTLVNDKITAAEAFCDHQQYVLSFAPHNLDVKTPSTLLPADKEEKRSNLRDEGTQTEDIDSTEPPATDAVENARKEVAQLRTARDSILVHRREVSDKIKEATVHELEDHKKLYEFEEAVDAIDTAVDYKNELICGRECILNNDNSPGKNETNLITRLKNLSVLDLQRLLCKFFNKVVDLRYSTKQLEKLVDDLETKHDQISRRFARNQKHVKELEEEYENRIKMILKHSKDPAAALGDYLHYSKTSKSARRKQYDLELSLTELLVRHGYLSNGADYEVNQIVKMLGIDALQLRLYQMEDEEDWRKPSSTIPVKLRSALMGGGGAPGLSSRVRDRIGGVDKFRERSGGGGMDKFRDRSSGNGMDRLRERSGGGGRPRERDAFSQNHSKGHNPLHTSSTTPLHHAHNYNAHYSSHATTSSTARRPTTNANGGYSTNNNHYNDRGRPNAHGHQPSSSHHHHGGQAGHQLDQSQYFSRGTEVKRENRKITIQVPQNHH